MTESIATHNGIITIRNTRTGDHRTFRIRTQPDDARFAPGKRVVSLLYNGDDDWSGFGFVGNNGQIHVWKSKRTGNFPVYARMLECPDRFVTKGAEYMWEGRCRKCNRRLTNPTSIETGIGPVCAGRTK